MNNYRIDFTNRHVLITAASSGLGAETAYQFASHGASIIAIGRSSTRLAILKQRLATVSASSAKHRFIVQDLSAESAADSVASDLVAFKTIPDIVVHNLGGTLKVRSFRTSIAEIEKVLWLNALFAVALNHLLLPHLFEKGSSRIIHISSISAKSLRGSGPYAASKAYLDAYTKCLSRELATSNILVCGVRPGAFFTENGDWADNLRERPQMVEDFLRHHHATGRLGTAKDIVPFVLILASEHSSWATGTIIDVDGGTM